MQSHNHQSGMDFTLYVLLLLSLLGNNLAYYLDKLSHHWMSSPNVSFYLLLQLPSDCSGVHSFSDTGPSFCVL